jgi:hypothetical protein
MSTAIFNNWKNITGTKMQTILQVVQTVKTDTFSTTSTTATNVTGLTVSITPYYPTSKILITAMIHVGTDNPSGGAWLIAGQIARGGTAIVRHDVASNRGRFAWGTQSTSNNDSTLCFPVIYLDSPSSTSPLTYAVQVQAESPRTVYINRGVENDGDSAISGRFVSTITAMEIAQ